MKKKCKHEISIYPVTIDFRGNQEIEGRCLECNQVWDERKIIKILNEYVNKTKED